MRVVLLGKGETALTIQTENGGVTEESSRTQYHRSLMQLGNPSRSQ